jgi:hypothetical protein
MLRKLIVTVLTVSFIFGTGYKSYGAENTSENKEIADYLERIGVVGDINDDFMKLYVPMSDGGKGLNEIVVNLKESDIVNRDGDKVDRNELVKDSIVRVKHSNFMTMSLPPIVNGIEITTDYLPNLSEYLVLGSEIGNTQNSRIFKDDNETTEIEFNETTEIIGIFGSRLNMEELTEGEEFLLWGNYKMDVSKSFTVKVAVQLIKESAESEITSPVVEALPESIVKVGWVTEVLNDAISINTIESIMPDGTFSDMETVLRIGETNILNVLGEKVTKEEIEVGMSVKVKHSPMMSRSFPPQTNAMEIIIDYPNISNMILLKDKVEETKDSIVFTTLNEDSVQTKYVFDEETEFMHLFKDFNYKDLEANGFLIIWPKFEVDKKTGDIINIKKTDDIIEVGLVQLVPQIGILNDTDVKVEQNAIDEQVEQNFIFVSSNNEISLHNNNINIAKKAFTNEEGTLMLPIRQIAEAYGFNVNWSEKESISVLVKGENFGVYGPKYENEWVWLEREEVISFGINDNKYTVLGEIRYLKENNKIVIKDEISYAPADFFENAFESLIVKG